MTTDFPSDPNARLGEYAVPTNASPVLCKSCQQQIIWTRTRTGANMPLSLATIRQGADGQRYALSHFSDCAQAAQHRRRPARTAARAQNPVGSLVSVDLRDLHDYLESHHLIVVGSTIADDGKGRLIVTLQTRRA